ncbi:hypothetical protein NIES2109_59980 (plasmid) [Nostoc sp. HK-01]|uniref:Uncharacterized protein n=1 Tax=Anabaenopsis circularis NIES-21 TaxID=1085406 RepID=A0A1Z4GRM9_9CYAN|nr:hypothetical protein NIES21_60230 [Anabaenopsis circularis NIES-21]BBD63148.1 hypothetical protein NIES2109_59980 [Nostoc sp. HK-01]
MLFRALAHWILKTKLLTTANAHSLGLLVLKTGQAGERRSYGAGGENRDEEAGGMEYNLSQHPCHTSPPASLHPCTERMPAITQSFLVRLLIWYYYQLGR